MRQPLLRWLLWLLAALVALQLAFALRIALMAVVDPQSTAFQRSEAWRLANEYRQLRWRQQWVDYDQMSVHLKRAVIASEDGSFTGHDGVDWDSLEQAWITNERRAQEAERLATRARDPARVKPPRVIGGSTITQQLAKNLLLSGERSLLRKGQELVLTLTLEAFLSKRRILEIYLNSVEFGQGVFGAEAAARHYFGKPARQLGAWEAARLAVMLPAPRRYEKRPNSEYLSGRANKVMSRMAAVEIP
jgi:monofunctional glycosyltransferase